MKPLPIYVGFDRNAEPIAYHTFCDSVIRHSSIPVAFIPLDLQNLKGAGYVQEDNRDGSNSFIYARFNVPHLQDYKGYALFFDGDMIVRSDVKELLDLADPYKAVQVVKHPEYTPKFSKKYLNAKQEAYPRKCWSSVILWNAGHHQNKKLTPDVVMNSTGAFLHRFQWLEDRFIGEIPKEWNLLELDQENNPNWKCCHFTNGTPCFEDWRKSPNASAWLSAYMKAIYPMKPHSGMASEL